MGAVFTRCAATGASVPTGHHMTEAQIQATSGVFSFRCRICNGVHSWTGSTAWVEERASKLRALIYGGQSDPR